MSGARINTLLDIVGYFVRSVDVGQFQQQPIIGSGRSARDEIGVGSDSEGGAVFGDRDGKYVYHDRTWYANDPRLNQVQAEFMATIWEDSFGPVDPVAVDPNAPRICTNELATDWSLAYVINIVTLANRGGNQQTFSDQTSVQNHGPQTHSRTDFLNVSSSTLATRANDYLTGNADPELRLTALTYRANLLDDKGWIFTLSVFLGWMVRTTFQHLDENWGWQIVTHIQSVEHRISPTDWSVSFALDQPTSFNQYEFLPSNYGWDQGKWDVDLWDQGLEPAGALWSSGYNWSDPNSKWGI